MQSQANYAALWAERNEKLAEIRRLEELVRVSQEEISQKRERLVEIDALAYRIQSQVSE